MKRSFKFWLGNILIILSLGILGYIYLPIIELYLLPPNVSSQLVVNAQTNKQFAIFIPIINAFAPIIDNVDPWNKSEYDAALKQGVADAKGSAAVGEKGTIFLFAHSSLPPWEMTRINTSFLRLPQLNIGDEIQIFSNGKVYKYKVVDKKEIWPTETQYLKDFSKTQLILQTCVPIGTDFKRLLVFAEPIN